MTPFPTSYRVQVGNATSGSFRITYRGNTTSTIPWNATAAQVKTALVGLPDDYTADNWVVVGALGGPWTITTPGPGAFTLTDTLVGGSATLKVELPDRTVNYNSLAAWAARTQQDWEDEIYGEQEDRWMTGVLGGLFQGLAQGKPFTAALLEALIKEIFDDEIPPIITNIQDARSAMRERFAERWESVAESRTRSLAAKLLARQRAKSANSFINDARVETEEFWTQTGSARSAAYKRNGLFSLEVTCTGTTPTTAWWNTVEDGTIQPMAVRPGDIVQIECYVFAPVQTGSATLNLVARPSSTAGGSETNILSTTSVTEGLWRRVYATYSVPEGYDGLDVGVQVTASGITAPATYKTYLDTLVCREATTSEKNRALHKARLRAATNLVSDPNIEDAGFWTQTSVAQSTSNPRTGNYSLAVTSQGATQVEALFNTNIDGEVEPIKARLGELFQVECYVYSPAANTDTSTVRLFARLANAKTGATTDVTLQSLTFSALTEGEYQRLSGWVKIPAGYNLLSAGVRLPAGLTTSGQTFFFDDLLIREGSAAQRLLDTLFDGFDGSSGAFGKSSDDVLGLLGSARNTWLSARLLARRRARSGNNLVSDAKIEDGNFWTQAGSAQTGAVRRGTNLYSLEVTGTGTTPTTVWWNTIDDGTIQTIPTWEDDVFFLQCWVYAPVQSGTGTIQLLGRAHNTSTGVTSDTTIATVTVTEGVWTRVSGVYTVPAGADAFSAGARFTASGITAPATYKWNLDSLLVREATLAQRNAAMHRSRLRAGSNAVADPQIDVASFWSQPNIAQSQDITPRSGTNTLKITSQGAAGTTECWFNTNIDGAVEPIRTRPGELHAVEAYVWSPASNSDTTTARLMVRLSNSRTGATSDVQLKETVFTALLENDFQRMSGYIRIPVGYNQFSAGLMLPQGLSVAGQSIYAGDLLIREATLAQRLADNLFDGFNGSTGSVGKDPDDVLGLVGPFRTDAQKTRQLARQRAKSGNNFVSDARVENAEYWSQTGSTRSTAFKRNGNYSLEITQSATPATAPTYAFWNTIEDGSVQPISTWPDDCLYMQCWVNAPVTTSIRLVVRAQNTATNAFTETVLSTVAVPANTWTKVSGVYTMPEGADGFSAGLAFPTSVAAGTKAYADSLLIREATQVQKTIDNLFDGLNNSSGSFGKTFQDLRDAAVVVRQTAANARRLSRQRAKSGNNFVNDARVEDSESWIQTGSTRSTAYKRNGQYSLEVTATGTATTTVWWNTLEDGTVQPISTWGDDCVFMQCWVLAPNQTGSATLNLVARTTNSQTGASAISVVDTAAVAEGGTWNRRFGVFTVPPGYDGLDVGVQVTAAGITAPSTFKVYLDSLLAREATAVQKTIDAIKDGLDGDGSTGNSQTVIAPRLKQAWANLWDGHKGNVPGTSTAKLPSDVRDAANLVYISASNGETNAGLAQDAALVADNLAVNAGMANNIVVDPDFEDSTVRRELSGGTGVYSTEQKQIGAQSFKLTVGGGGFAGIYLTAWPVDASKSLLYPVVAGQVYNYDLFTYAHASNTSSAQIYLQFELTYLNGTIGSTVAATRNQTKGSWDRWTGTYTIPANVVKMRPWLYITGANSGESIYIDRALIWR